VADGKPVPPAFQEMARLVDARGKYKWAITERLNQALEANRFEQAKAYHYHDRMPLARAQNDTLMMMLEELTVGRARLQGKEVRDKIVQLVQKIHAEAQNGAAMPMPKQVCVARRKAMWTVASTFR
jgi:hypothetical protein